MTNFKKVYNSNNFYFRLLWQIILNKASKSLRFHSVKWQICRKFTTPVTSTFLSYEKLYLIRLPSHWYLKLAPLTLINEEQISHKLMQLARRGKKSQGRLPTVRILFTVLPATVLIGYELKRLIYANCCNVDNDVGFAGKKTILESSVQTKVRRDYAKIITNSLKQTTAN